MSDMNEYARIKEIGKVITGKTPSTENEENFDGEFPFITPSDISTFDEKYIVETERTISSKGYKKMKNNLLPMNTICFVCIGSTIGKMCLTKKPSFTNQQINALIVNENYDAQYVFYLLRYVKGYFQQIGAGTGSGKGIVNKSTFEKSRICVEKKLLTQKEISSILSAYDDLIENNNKRIKILEQMAENLYKEWFVRFRFPGHETAEFENGIPKGWEIRRLDEVSKLSAGGDAPKDFSLEQSKEYPIPIYSNGMANDGLYGYCKKPTRTAKSITISARGTVGFVCLRFQPYMPIVRLVSIEPKNESLDVFYLYYYFKENSIEGYGTSQQQITIPYLSKKKILIPKINLMEKFGIYTAKLYDKINVLKEKNQNLIKQRDLLLPRLMSGKLEV